MSLLGELRDERAVHELDERVDQRLRMDDDVDALLRQAEEEVRLDDLEALVHHRRGVDRDLRPHLPRRVRERVRDRDRVEGVEAPLAERAARRREHEALRLLGAAAAHRLVDRAVLGVDRDDLRLRPRGLREDQRAGDDERLLVGEREPLAGADRGERRAQPQRADEPADDGVGVRVRGGLGRGPPSPPRSGSRARPAGAARAARRPRPSRSRRASDGSARPARPAARASGRPRAPRRGSGPERPPRRRATSARSSPWSPGSRGISWRTAAL